MTEQSTQCSTALRRHVAQPLDQLLDLRRGVPGTPSPLVRRVVLEAGRRSPAPARPDRALLEAAAAVGADVVQHGLGALRTERALVGADPGGHVVGWEVPVAELAVRAQLEHVFAPLRDEKARTSVPGPSAAYDCRVVRAMCCPAGRSPASSRWGRCTARDA